MDSLAIRSATVADAEALRAIYEPYVRYTAITFEYEVPTTSEFARRIAITLERYPYLVAECQGQIVGYAYAGVFKDRAAYDWSCETSVYVARYQRRHGIGSALYDELEAQLAARGILNLYACIAYPTQEDARLTLDSVRFHSSRGYQQVGHFHACGYKFGTWYDMVWMEKMIGNHLTEHLHSVLGTPSPSSFR